MKPFPSIDLHAVACQTVLTHGFRIEFPPEAVAETNAAQKSSFESTELRDLSTWLWSSIDNDDSRDLDQIEFVERQNNITHIYVAVADVGVIMLPDSVIQLTEYANDKNHSEYASGDEAAEIHRHRNSIASCFT